MLREHTTRNHRPPFDPRCEFTYSRSMQVGGGPVTAGGKVDKAALDPRRLRQMYDARRVQYAPGQRPGRPAPKPLSVGPTDMKNPGVAHPPEKKVVQRVTRAVSRRAAA